MPFIQIDNYFDKRFLEWDGKPNQVPTKRDLKRIQSEAFRDAEKLRGSADVKATDVYADAYGRDADFYAFTRWLEAYGKVMDPVTMLIMDTDREFLKFLKRPR